MDFIKIWNQTTGVVIDTDKYGFKQTPVNAEELQEALSYFQAASRYGWPDPTEDMTHQEIIDAYHKTLRYEMNEGEIEINLSNEQVT